MVKDDTFYQWRRQYVRENKSNVCPTLTANMGTGGHNVPLIKDDYGIRKLSPRECFLFQGYPVNYSGSNTKNITNIFEGLNKKQYVTKPTETTLKPNKLKRNSLLFPFADEYKKPASITPEKLNLTNWENKFKETQNRNTRKSKDYQYLQSDQISKGNTRKMIAFWENMIKKQNNHLKTLDVERNLKRNKNYTVNPLDEYSGIPANSSSSKPTINGFSKLSRSDKRAKTQKLVTFWENEINNEKNRFLKNNKDYLQNPNPEYISHPSNKRKESIKKNACIKK